MKAIIVCTSVSHGNTRRIADVIAEVLDARVVEPGEIDSAELAGYDLVGFGSGIYL
ncbi:MAG: flavodoxin domain-containing protein, partial [Rhodococcus sp. (in: high G+C Gram-positive bacteria)]